MKKLQIGSDEELIKQCSQGNHAAFDILFKKYARPLTYFIYQNVHDHDRAQDIFQDTFMKVLEKAGSFNDQYRFSTWLYRIALNLSINELRKKQRENSRFLNISIYDAPENTLTALSILQNRETPYDTTMKNDMLDRIDEAVTRLPAPKRVSFLLKFYHNLSYEEIAQIIGCSTGTVKSRIHYAVEQIQILAGK